MLSSCSNPLPIIVICGPTASGKSTLATEIVERLPCEIISADSVQVYQEFEIGTSKPSLEVRDRIAHHLVDIIEPVQSFSAHDFQQRADEAIAGVRSRSKIPLIVGGSSLYVQALIRGLFEAPKADDDIRRRHQEIISTGGIGSLYEQLQNVDPASSRKIHQNDALRISRALEVYEQTGVPISVFRQSHQFRQQRYDALMFSIRLPRDVLRFRIRDRVDQMVALGLVSEVQTLLDKGYQQVQPMRSLGYRQISEYFAGKLSLDMAISKIKKQTWAFAKRQIRHVQQFETALGLLSLDCQSPNDLDIKMIVDKIEKFFA